MRTYVDLAGLRGADTDDSGMILGFLTRPIRLRLRSATWCGTISAPAIDDWQWRDLSKAEWISFDREESKESK